MYLHKVSEVTVWGEVKKQQVKLIERPLLAHKGNYLKQPNANLSPKDGANA